MVVVELGSAEGRRIVLENKRKLKSEKVWIEEDLM